MTPNPFRGSVAADPWAASTPVSVPAIHARPLERCVRAIADARQPGGAAGVGVVVRGEPGSGKTHLLSRLRRHLLETSPDQQGYVYLRLATHPSALKRHIRRVVAGDLLRSTGASPTPLERMALVRLNGLDARVSPERWRELANLPLAEVLEELGLQLGLSGGFVTALRHLLLRTNRLAAASWHKGEALDEGSATQLGLALPAGDGSPIEAENVARAWLDDVCKLACPEQPIVICADQIEALQTTPDDKHALFEYAAFVAELLNSTHHLVVISCMQSAIFELLASSAAEYAWDRLLGAGDVGLDPLDEAQSRELLSHRLRGAGIDPPPGEGPLWPLRETSFASMWAVNSRNTTPRSLLHWAAERWDEALAGTDSSPPPPAAQPDWFEVEWDRRLERARAEANAAAVTLPDGIPRLLRVLRPDLQVEGGDRLVDFVLRGSGPPIGVRICVGDARTLVNPLKELKVSGGPAGDPRRLVLLTDEQNPIRTTARKTHEHFQQLVAAGATHQPVSAEALFALDAMRKLLADAQAGDLARNGDTLAPTTVLAWLREHLPSSLEPLAQVLTGGGGTAPDDEVERVYTFVLERYVGSVPDAQATSGLSAAQIEAAAGRRPDLIGFISGNPAVVFRVCPSRPPLSEVI